MSLNATDLLVRKELTQCALGELINTFANDLKWGNKKSKSEWKTLLLLQIYLEMISDYTLGSTNNCITEIELNSILEKTSKLADICYSAPGTSYI